MEFKLNRAYLDTCVFIYGLMQDCNSRLMLNLAEIGAFLPVISDHTLKEVYMWFERTKRREEATDVRYWIETLPQIEIVRDYEIKKHIKKYTKTINKKDLPHLVATMIAKPDYFVSTNRHFIERKFRNISVMTPKEFIENILKLKGRKMVY